MGDAYSAETRGIRVLVRARYLEDQSDAEQGTWFWAYQVTIHNTSAITVQLLRRTWRITDGAGRVHIVQGDGVVGEQPVLDPGDSFEYTSGTPLETPSGFMSGLYHMTATLTGEAFDVEIPAFSLDSPTARRLLH